MTGPLVFAALGILAILVGVYAARGQQRMLSARVGENNAKLARNNTRILFVGLGVVFLIVALLGLIGELTR
ncbi:hypothetical protein ACWGII_18475 [Streptomyces sp. NPDC054855]